MQSEFFKATIKTAQGKRDSYSIEEAYKLLDYYETIYKTAIKETKELKDGKFYYVEREMYLFYNDETSVHNEVTVWIYYKIR